MASGPIDKSILFLGIADFLTQFPDLYQEKQDKAGSSNANADSTGKVIAAWGNQTDNITLALVQAIEDGDIGVNTFTNLGTPEVTPSATDSGGTAIGSIDLGFGTATPPLGTFLVVDANTNPVGLTDIEFFADVGLTRLIYKVIDKPLDTTVTHTDATPFYLGDLTGNLALDNLLHYRITNNGTVTTTYDIHLRAKDG